MNCQDSKRKLTAILSADVKGYSRLMSQDEEATVKTLKQHRLTISGLVSEHRGRVVDSPGDNILAEFGSVVDAVKCAVKIQETLKGKSAEVPENRRMEFRIGVNLGDVIEEEERIYGDGVNIAARLEGLAEAGSVCISGTAFDHVKNKLQVGYQYLGKQTVKNIPDPVRAYKVLMEPGSAGKVIGEKEPKQKRWGWKSVAAIAVLFLVASGLVWNAYWREPKIEPASKEKMAFPLPDKPSIAVLPFTNMTGDPSQEFLPDGITENIITALSVVPQLFVIARNSTFAYKGKSVKVQQVAEELGVRYVLEGSVARSGDRIRVTAQLIDALKGHHLWAERYDRDLKDLFAMQDEVALKVLMATRVKITEGEQSLGYGKYYGGKHGLDCYLKIMEGNDLVFRRNTKDNNLARRIAEEALGMCPEVPTAYLLMASVHSNDYWFGSAGSTLEPVEKAIDLTQKALALDDALAEAHSLLGYLYTEKREYEKGIAEGERAVTLNSGVATVLGYYGFSLSVAGRAEEAIPFLQKAIRLNPFGSFPSCYNALGNALMFAGRYEEAVSAYNKYIQSTPNFVWAHVTLAATYSMMGRAKEAQAEAAEVLRINPKFSLDFWAKTALVRDQSIRDRILDALRKAGLPDKPPLPFPDKPSIAVLPFVNMSDDPQQEYFSDGMTEDLITDLSKISGLFIIARNSTFVYKGKAVNVQQICRELGVKYVLEGSVRRAGDQVRINAQLVDGTTGQHLWAERYDGSMRDVFALQDKINQKIVAALAVKLTTGERTLLTEKGTNDPAAYEEFLKGREHYLRNTKEDFAKAEECFKKAIELDPNFSRARASVALLYFDAANQGVKMREAFKISMVDVRLRARHYLTEALKNPNSIAYQVAGVMDLNLRQWDAAISQLEKALALDPNDTVCHGHMSWALSMSGRAVEGMEYAKNGMRLDPLNPGRHLVRIGLAHFCMSEWQEAVTAIEKALKLNPELSLFGTILASAYAHLSLDAEAKAAYHAYCERPYFDMFFWPFKDRQVSDSFLDGLQKAGVPAVRIEWSRVYQVSKEDQLTGDELRAFYYPSTTTGYSQGGMDWMLEIAKDGVATFREGTLPGGTDRGRSWLEGDRHWLQFQKYYSGTAYCSTVFRNPKGTPEGKNEYISFNDVWPTRFSRVR